MVRYDMASFQTKTFLPYEQELNGEDEERHSSQKHSRSALKSITQVLGTCRTNIATTFHGLGHESVSWFERLPFVVWFDSRFPGWQAGVVIGIFIAILVLILNIVFFVLAIRHHWGLDGLGTLIEGQCDTIDKWNKFAHAFINIMSTVLLMQSNYCMQLLASPSRRDVDVAHRKREWVDIGIQSFRNVWKRHISPWRCVCWIILALSSVPLHLLWNSVIIFSPSAYQYNQLAVTTGFVNGLPFNSDGYIYMANANPQWGIYPDNLYIVQQDLQHYTSLNNTVCKQLYAQSFVRDRSDVILVTTPETPETNTSTVLGGSMGGSGPWPYQWMCPNGTNQNFKCYDEIRQPEQQWNILNGEGVEVAVQYCLSKPMEMRCKLEYGFWIALFTVIANAFKVVCFVVTFHVMKSHTKDCEAAGAQSRSSEKLLITTGDAIASFLESPDRETLGMSIVERRDFSNGIWNLRWVPIGAMQWRERYECSWFRAIGLQQWLIGMIPLATLALAPSIFLLSKLNWFMNDIVITREVIDQLGMGNPSGLFLLGSSDGNEQFMGWALLGKVALANSPQLVVSVAYYLWSNHLAAMIAAREYDAYAAPILSKDGSTKPANKRGLRVTDPQKQSEQKSTRFLTVPVRYAFVNLVLWTLLHYLASQAIFFARVDMLDHWLQVTQFSISQVGYSVLGLIYFLVCAYVVFIYAFWTSLRRLQNKMPLAATCSGALSAACHPRDPWTAHHQRRVHWGIEMVGEDESNYSNTEKLWRCTFTSGNAHYPETDLFYA